jgi:hypothetical protein
MSRWVDDESTLEELLPESSRSFCHHDLHIVVECDRPLASSTRHCLDDLDQVVIVRGRERACERDVVGGEHTLTLAIPDSRMSSAHAKLRRTEGGFMLEDTGSRNGSYLMGRRVDRAALIDGSIFELGHTRFLLRSHVLPKKGLVEGPPDLILPSFPQTALATVNHELEALYARLLVAARAHVPILIVGEAGSGKDTLALALHEEVGQQGEFVAIDCAQFGRSQRTGRTGDDLVGALAEAFDRASGGTLFLNEIEELSPVAQLALQPMLESRSPSGIMLVSSLRARRDLRSDVPRIRPELLALLARFTLPLPPLRDRREDIGTLVSHILPRWGGVDVERITMDPSMAQALLLHDWPYNVGELDSCIRTAIALSTDACIQWSPATLVRKTPRAGPAVHKLEPAPNPQRPATASHTDVTPPSAEPDLDFVQNVRRALKCNLSVAGLQKNSLLHSHMVLRATQGSSAANAAIPALRDIVLSAIDAMRSSSPRGDKQSSVLLLTFIKPTSTQQEAADRLAMAFGTYRRYVTSALAELTSILWFNEMSARAVGDRHLPSPNVHNTAPERLA